MTSLRVFPGRCLAVVAVLAVRSDCCRCFQQMISLKMFQGTVSQGLLGAIPLSMELIGRLYQCHIDLTDV